MRTQESSKNAITSLIFYFINSIFTFISKTVFIQYLGIEYAGLNSLFTNILGVLNIAELGLSTAIGYSLYKPLAENDTKTINEILKLFKYLYRIVGIVILIIGIIVVFFLPYFINSNISLFEIRSSFLLFLIATSISYLFTFLNVLPSADQKNYIVTKIQGITKVIKCIIQLFAIVIFQNYYVWLFLEIGWNLVGYIYTNFVIRRKYLYYQDYKELKFFELLKKYKEVMKRVKDLFYHKIGSLAVNQTDNIVISYFCNLTTVGIYGNYILVFNLVVGIFEQAFSSVTASIGNLIINKGEKATYNLWKELHILIVFLTVVSCYLFYKLINPFITVWIGKEYLLTNVVVLFITLNIMFKIIKQPIDKFKEAFGIFWDKQAPFFEAIINLIVSIALAMKFGVLGVVIGTVVSNIIIIAIWKPYVTFKYGFKEKFIEYIKLNIPLVVMSVISIFSIDYFINYIEISINNAWINLIITGIIYGMVATIIAFMFFVIYKPFRITFLKYISIFKSLILNRKINKKI